MSKASNSRFLASKGRENNRQLLDKRAIVCCIVPGKRADFFLDLELFKTVRNLTCKVGARVGFSDSGVKLIS